jgi:hypothetical protein
MKPKAHRSDRQNWPEFDSALLRGISDAFRARRKALRYRASIVCAREFTEMTDGSMECMDVMLKTYSVRGFDLRFWADGQMWLGVHVSARGTNKGWAFQDCFHGHVDDVGPGTLVKMTEATLDIWFGNAPASEREQLRTLWQRVQPVTDV